MWTKSIEKKMLANLFLLTSSLVKNKYGKLIEYKIIESDSKCNKVEIVFIRKDRTYSETDSIRYSFKIIHYELEINCRFYNSRGSFVTKALRNRTEIKDISKLLGHSGIETTENYYILLAPLMIGLKLTILLKKKLI